MPDHKENTPHNQTSDKGNAILRVFGLGMEGRAMPSRERQKRWLLLSVCSAAITFALLSIALLPGMAGRGRAELPPSVKAQSLAAPAWKAVPPLEFTFAIDQMDIECKEEIRV